MLASSAGRPYHAWTFGAKPIESPAFREKRNRVQLRLISNTSCCAARHDGTCLVAGDTQGVIHVIDALSLKKVNLFCRTHALFF